MKKPLIVILGPTASGKTKIVLKLAKKFNGEIICADSRTIYQKMDIGTAKPTFRERQEIVHHLLDIVKPGRSFSVAQFQKMAYKTIDQVHQRKKLPFLVGGTGLYIDAVCEGFIIPKPKPNLKLRQKLEKMPSSKLLKTLKEKDPLALKFIAPTNKRRIVRALEVILTTKKPFSEQQKKSPPPYKILKIGLKISREKLYQNIEKRVAKMIKMGLVDEVRKLCKSGFDFGQPGLSGLGYRQFEDYFKGKMNLEEAVNNIKKETKAYARRQLSWFRRDKKIIWLEPEQIEGRIKAWLVREAN